jgi:integrase
VAREQYLDYKFREKHGLPVVSKRFEDVANLAILDMQRQLDAGAGRKVYKDYIQSINSYFIPFFGKTFITNLDHDTIRDFNTWRAAKIGHEPKASTLNTHNSAMNRVFDEAVARGYLPAGKMPTWIEAGKLGKSRDMRYLLRDYVLILANTGMRHGTEAQNLRWRHVHVFEEKGLKYVELHLDGKTVAHDAIGRAGTIKYLERIHSRTLAIQSTPFAQMLKQKLDLPVFCLPDGTVTENLRQTFKVFLKENDLLKCPKTGQERTLYSLRHTYATFALVKDGIDIHTLARQMGTSVGMIEKHYSYLTPRMKKDILTGKRYELTREQYEAQLVEAAEE